MLATSAFGFGCFKTLSLTLIIPDITTTLSNNCLLLFMINKEEEKLNVSRQIISKRVQKASKIQLNYFIAMK